MIDCSPDRSQKGKVVVSLGGRSVRVDPLSPISIRRAADELGVPEADVRAALFPPEEPIEFTVWNGDAAYSAAEPLDALDAALAAAQPDDFLRWSKRNTLCAVDIDVHAARSAAWLAELADTSGARRAWLTKSGGGRLIFAGKGAEGMAAAAVVLLDWGAPDWVERVELLANTRAPRGDVLRLLGADIDWLRARAVGDALSDFDRDEVDAYLQREGLSRGRNSHDLCPIAPGEGAGKGDPVFVGDNGVYCHRCAGVNGDGWRPWARLLGVAQEPHPLILAARERVHWAHQRIVMRSTWSSKVPWWVARCAYEALLGEDAEGVFNRDWHWFRSEGGAWINPRTGSGETAGEAINTLSWTQGDATRRAQARNASPLAGVVPVRPVSVCLRPDVVPEGVVIWQRRDDVDPFRDGLLSWEAAFSRLCEDFPGCDPLYLKLCLVAAVCAEGGKGKYALLVTGTSGSAKSTVPRLAAGILGADSADLRIDVSAEEWGRQVGQALESGARPLMVNELDKVPNFRKHLDKLLRLQDPHQWRPLYGSDIKSAWRSPLIVTGVIKPEAFEEAEAGRRFRHLHLLEKVPSWYGRELEGWRMELDAGERSLGLKPGEGWRVLVADSLLRWAVDFAAEHGNDWDTCADALGVRGSDGSDVEDREVVLEAYRAIFNHCCSSYDATPSTSARYPAEHHWVDLTSEAASKILEPIMPDHDDVRTQRFILRKQLESFNWSGFLGVKMICEVRLHRRAFVGRFGFPDLGQRGGLRQNWVWNAAGHVRT